VRNVGPLSKAGIFRTKSVSRAAVLLCANAKFEFREDTSGNLEEGGRRSEMEIHTWLRYRYVGVGKVEGKLKIVRPNFGNRQVSVLSQAASLG
jgi:hypothetical protein